MPLDPILNQTLKEMWRLDEKLEGGKVLTPPEKNFYNEHIADIATYYEKSNRFWSEKKPLDL